MADLAVMSAQYWRSPVLVSCENGVGDGRQASARSDSWSGKCVLLWEVARLCRIGVRLTQQRCPRALPQYGDNRQSVCSTSFEILQDFVLVRLSAQLTK